MVRFWKPPPPPPPPPPAVSLEAALPGLLALVLLLLLLLQLWRRPTPRREKEDAAQIQHADSFDAPSGWDDEDFEITFNQLFRRRLSQLELDPSKLLGSIVTQLGQRAFFFISSALAVLAVLVQHVLSRVRSIDGGGLVWVRAFTARRKASMQTVLGTLRYEALAIKLFGAVDDDGDGIDPSELYSLTLEIYCKVTQYVPQASLLARSPHPPASRVATLPPPLLLCAPSTFTSPSSSAVGHLPPRPRHRC